jgi:hypothetical protein
MAVLKTGGFMRTFVVRCVALGVACTSFAIGQGTFGQIAYGGCLQTTFTLVNTSTAAANVGLYFYADDGSPLSAPVQGIGNVSSYQLTIPVSGVRSIVLSNSDVNTTQGWANITTAGGLTVRGQGSFRCHNPGGQDFEAIVPLTTESSPCILPFPPSPNPAILVPFDNTAYGDTGGQHVTALALANTTNSPLSIPVEFDDEFNNPLVTDTLNLAAMNHTAFATTTKYPALVGQKGILRIKVSTLNLTVLALLFNNTAAGAFTTIIPITQ